MKVVISYFRATPELELYLGKHKLRSLGITTVFDLRSDTEIEKYASQQPHIDGVQILRTPIFRTEDYSPEAMSRQVAFFQDICFTYIFK